MLNPPNASSSIEHAPTLERGAPSAIARRALAVVRVVVATLIAIHPLYAALHPDYVLGLVASLNARGVPVGVAAVWIVGALCVAFCVAIAANRFVAPAAVGQIALLAAGVAHFHAPRWYVVGGAVDEGLPGSELHVLAIACLVAVLFARSRGDDASDARALRALSGVRIVAALHLIAHPLHAILLWDVEGMRGWGEGMEARGFPFGVAMVWTVVFVQVACSLALLANRLVVPACVGHLVILSVGVWVSHAPHWFVVGPGEGGMEYSVLLMTCFASVLAVQPWAELRARVLSRRAGARAKA